MPMSCVSRLSLCHDPSSQEHLPASTREGNRGSGEATWEARPTHPACLTMEAFRQRRCKGHRIRCGAQRMMTVVASRSRGGEVQQGTGAWVATSALGIGRTICSQGWAAIGIGNGERSWRLTCCSSTTSEQQESTPRSTGPSCCASPFGQPQETETVPVIAQKIDAAAVAVCRSTARAAIQAKSWQIGRAHV